MKQRKDSSKNKGYISINRSIKDSWIWDDAVFLKRWIHLCMAASFTDRQVRIGRKTVHIERGQFMCSLRELGNEWKIGPSGVMKFMNKLVDDNLIEMTVLEGRTIVKILVDENYDFNTIFNGVTNKRQKIYNHQKKQTTKNSGEHITASTSIDYKEQVNRSGTPQETPQETPNELVITDVTKNRRTPQETPQETPKSDSMPENTPKTALLGNFTTKQQEIGEQVTRSESEDCKEQVNSSPSVGNTAGNTAGNTLLIDNHSIIENRRTPQETRQDTSLLISNNTIKNVNKYEWGVAFFEGKIFEIVRHGEEEPPSFAPPPPFFDDHELFGTFYKISECMEVFLSHDRMQKFRDVVFQSGPFPGNDKGATAVFKWASAFNRFLDDNGEVEKKCSQWASAFVKWLGRMDRTQNPDEVSIFKSKNNSKNASGFKRNSQQSSQTNPSTAGSGRKYSKA